MNKQTMEVIFSSKKMDYETPDWFFNLLNDEFNFGMDACATKEDTKCTLFISPEIDALKQNWSSALTYWCNPPYGRALGKWLRKAYEESQKGVRVVCLIPDRPDTKYWWDYCTKAYEIRHLKGRLKFRGAEHAAPFPSAVAIFKPFDEIPAGLTHSKIIFNDRKVITRYWDPKTNTYAGE
jgi:phage N-6-adenine-methyltransferase